MTSSEYKQVHTFLNCCIWVNVCAVYIQVC